MDPLNNQAPCVPPALGYRPPGARGDHGWVRLGFAMARWSVSWCRGGSRPKLPWALDSQVGWLVSGGGCDPVAAVPCLYLLVDGVHASGQPWYSDRGHFELVIALSTPTTSREAREVYVWRTMSSKVNIPAQRRLYVKNLN